MSKDYKIFPSKKKIVNENNLKESIVESDIYFDFSLLDEINFVEEYERDIIEKDIMKAVGVCWYNQPMPNIIIYNEFVHYIGQTKTAFTRVYNKNYKRIMVIVEVTDISIERQQRKSVYDNKLETKYKYNAKIKENRVGEQKDIELA